MKFIKLNSVHENEIIAIEVKNFNHIVMEQQSEKTIIDMGKLRSFSVKETIDSIKFQAPKSYSSQNRAVTKEDYITVIQQNNLGYSFDAVNVWGGQENPTPVYGQVFISIKPAGAYTLTATQKQRLINDVIKPVSVMTVEPTLVDPDYTYIQLTANVLFDSKKTNLTSSQIQAAVKTAISSLAATNLNTFNSTFSATDFTNAIAAVSPAIITNEISVKLQKKFYPNLTTPSMMFAKFNGFLNCTDGELVTPLWNIPRCSGVP